MPSQISNASAIRSSGWSVRAYASFITGGTPVATGTLTTGPTYPMGGVSPFLATTYVTGAYTDVERGMEVVFYDAGSGKFKGRTRVRFSGGLTAVALPVREFSQASLNLSAGDVFQIYDEFRLHDKLVAALADFPPDMLFFTDEGSNPPPLACSGGHWAGFVDAGQTYATVLTKGDTSIAVDPDSGGSLTHLWTLPSGVAFAPGSASSDANPTLRANVGEWVVYHTVTDASNSKSVTQHIVLKAHDANSMPHRVLYTPDDASAESGFGGSVQIVSGATTQADIPDGCLCIIWGVEYLNGTPVAYRNAAPGRGHIFAVGIARRDTQSGTPDGSRTVTVEVISPLTRLRELTSYSKVMLNEATPDSWSEMKTLSVKRAIIQIIQFYTMLVEAGFDIVFDADFINYLYPAFYLNASDFIGQLNELVQGVDARITCDRTGRFSIHTDPKYIPEADRASVTKTWTFARRDVLAFDFPREHFNNVRVLKASGFTGGASNNQPLFSLYPGKADAEGLNTPNRERLIVTDQDDLNERTGRYGAALDNVFQNSDGEYYRAFPLTLTLRGIYDFFDFSKEYVDFSENLQDLARDVDLTDFLFCLKSTRVDYDFALGSATTTAVFDVVTSAAQGETFLYPVQPTTDYTPSDYVPLPYTPPTVGGSRLPLWNGVDLAPTKMFLLASSHAKAYIVTAWNPVSGVLSETEISTGLSGTGIWATSDPYDYRRRFALTTNGLYRCDDIWAASPSWTQVASNAAMFNGDSSGIGTAVWMSINRRGWILVTSGFSNAITFNYGASWTFTDIAGSPGTAATALSKDTMQVAVSARNSGSQGWLYAAAGNGTGGNDSILKSTDWGLTWATVDADIGSAFDVTPRIDIPYVRIDGTTPNTNDASQELWLTYGAGHSGNAGELWLSQNGGASWTTKISHSGSGIPVPAGSICGTPIRTFTFNGARVQVATLQTGAGGDQGGFLITNDAGATETYRASIGGTGSNFEAFINGYPEHSMATLYWDRNGVVKWTLDDGLTVVLATNPSGITGWAYAEWDLSERVAPG